MTELFLLDRLQESSAGIRILNFYFKLFDFLHRRNIMKLLKASFLTLFAVAFLAGTSLAKTVTIDDFSAYEVRRGIGSGELVQIPGTNDYEANFSDTITFTLTEAGSFSFNLFEKDVRNSATGYNEWVEIDTATFAGDVPSFTPWMKSGDFMKATMDWGVLAAGTYNLTLDGYAFSAKYPLTDYRIMDIDFKPVPVPTTIMLLSLGLLGLAGKARNRK